MCHYLMGLAKTTIGEVKKKKTNIMGIFFILIHIR